jgi:hypothetical protein
MASRKVDDRMSDELLREIDERLRNVEIDTSEIKTNIQTIFTVGRYLAMIVAASLGIDIIPMLGGI